MALILLHGQRRKWNNLTLRRKKILTKNNSHYLYSSVEHLYLPRSEADHGLITIENLFYRKLVLMAWHLSCSTDCLVQLCSDLDQSLPPRISIHSRAKSYCSSLSVSSEFELYLVSNLKRTIHEKQVNSLVESLTVKLLHGKFFSSLRSPEIDKYGSLRWLQQHLHSEFDLTILAIQDQVLPTRVYKA